MYPKEVRAMNNRTQNVVHDALKSLLHKTIEHTANSVECPFAWAYQPKRPQRIEEQYSRTES